MLTIKPLEFCHAKKVAEIESELIAKISAENVEKTTQMERPKYLVLASENDEVIGFLEYSMIVPEIEIFEIAIDKNFQGKGYSKLLMDYLLKFAKEKNCETIFLEVNSINKKAINLYQKYGFVKFGERKNYYGTSDAVNMKLKI